MRHIFAKIADKAIPVKSDEYKKLVVRTYIKVPGFIFFSNAILNLWKGIYCAIRGNEKQKQIEFINGSIKWGTHIAKKTKTQIKELNTIEVPDSGHFIFLNHVNEMDFPFDCKIAKKPFLANQELKKGMINLSFKLKIPILLILKTGMTGFHSSTYENTVLYKSIGIIKPDSFETWEEFRDHIHSIMKQEKTNLDLEIKNNK